MRAATRSGTNISFNAAYRKPKCGANQVFLKVKAAGINPIDYKIRWPLAGTLVGFDVSGIVEEVGNNVSKFKVGDEVYGVVDGSLAEYNVSDGKALALKPKTLSFTEAAALGVAYLTSYQALKNHGGFQKGDRVLIIGASGGTGTSGVQLAKALGAKDIIGVCSGRNAELVRSLGATEVIDYTKSSISDYLKENGVVPDAKKFDIIYDCATHSGGGENYYTSSKALLKPGERHGQYVAINGSPGFWIRSMTGLFTRANEHLFVTSGNTAEYEAVGRIMDGLEGGEPIKPIIHEEVPFSEEGLKKGFDMLKSRRAVGKIVFNMDL